MFGLYLIGVDLLPRRRKSPLFSCPPQPLLLLILLLLDDPQPNPCGMVVCVFNEIVGQTDLQ